MKKQPNAAPSAGPTTPAADATGPIRFAWLTPRIAALIVFVIAAVVYAVSMNRTFGFVDKGELVAVAGTAGIAHPTGYPTIMLMGYAFTKLVPLRPVLALNLMSALLTAIGAGVLVFLYDELLRRIPAAVRPSTRDRKQTPATPGPAGSIVADARVRTVLAACGALMTAFTATWWNQGNGFEVYSLHAVMMPLVTLLFLRWLGAIEHRLYTRGDDRPADNPRSPMRSGILFGLVTGLSFTNHLTTVLLAPAFLVLFLWTIGRRADDGLSASASITTRIMYWLPLIAAIAISLVIRSVLFTWGPVAVAASLLISLFVDGLTMFYYRSHGERTSGYKGVGSRAAQGARFVGAFLAAFVVGLAPYLWLVVRAGQHPRFNWGDPSTFGNLLDHVSGKIYQIYMNASAGVFAQQTKYFFSHLPAEMVYAGLVVAALGFVVAMRRIRLAVFLWLLFAFCIYWSGRYEIMEIGPYYMTAILAVGIWFVLGLAWLHERIGTLPTLCLAAALAVLNCAGNYAESNESRNTLVEDMTVNVLDNLPKNSIIFSSQWDFWVAGSFYMQEVERVRPDVVVIDPELLRRRWYVDELTAAYPAIMGPVRQEAERFKSEVYKFDHDLPYNGAEIDAAYFGLMNAIIERHIAERTVFVGGEVDPKIGDRYRRTPNYLALRLMRDSTYLAESFPKYRFAFWDRRVDGYTAKVYELYGRSAYARALYEAQSNHLDAARKYFDLALSFDPGFGARDIPDLPLNSEDQVKGMIDFFSDVRRDYARFRQAVGH